MDSNSAKEYGLIDEILQASKVDKQPVSAPSDGAKG
jgi:ATP-dependent protease ClpP protease subunit